MLFAPERHRPVVVPEPVKVSRKIRRAARMLDRKWPGWEYEVNLGKLQMRSAYRCVLGQLYGTYELGLSLEGLGLRPSLRHHRAFRAEASDDEWAREISRRRRCPA